MKNIKQWLEPTKNKWIMTGIGILIICVAGLGVLFITQPKQANYELVLKASSPDVIIVEYGEPAGETKFSDNFELKRDGELVDDLSNISFRNELVKPREVTFKLTEEQLKVANEKSKNDIEFNDEQKQIIDENAKRKIEAYEQETKLAEATLTVIIIDTKAPVIEPIADIETEIGIPIEFTNKFKASDAVDGAIEVKVDKEPDYSVAGVNELKAVATDSNGNKTELAFNVIVKDAEVEAALPDTNGNDVSSSGNGSSNTNTSSNNNNTSNSGGNTTQPTNPVTPAPQPEQPKPEVPSLPQYTQGQHVGDGIYFYKDYGSYEGCNAVVMEENNKHVFEWSSNMCSSEGFMFYTID